MNRQYNEPWTDADEATLRELVSRGDMSVRQIGERMGRSKAAIQARKNHLGLVQAKVTSEQRKAQMAELLANGATVAEAALSMGFSIPVGRNIFTEIRRDLGWQAR